MIEIRIPATSANMGPGFDCLGIALNMYNIFYLEETASGLDITDCDEAFQNKNNLVYTSMQRCFKKINYTPRGIKIKFETSIPVSRGLGSSATCILGGVLGANEIAGNILNKNEILEIATEIEGHPDNVAPALLGGMVISIKNEVDDKVYYEKIKLSKGFKLCALIPNFKLSTVSSRAVLPDKVTYKDCVFNISRASLLIAALGNGSFEQIKIACQDRLHQPYRGILIENYEEIMFQSNKLGSLGVFLSGSGPSIMILLKENDEKFIPLMRQYLTSLNNQWLINELIPDFVGATIKKY